MTYSLKERSEITSRATSIFLKRLENAFDSDSLNDFLELLGIELDEQENPAYTLYNRKTKIYVLGALAGKKKDYIMCAKKLGINEQNIEFKEYDAMTNFNIEKLRFSSTISDIICGPIPHKTSRIGDNSSFIAILKKHPNQFPKVFIATANESLKLTISNFTQGLLQTRYMEKFGNNK